MARLELPNLARNGIVSLKPLACLTQHTSLNLYGNPEEDLSAHVSVTKLQELPLSQTTNHALDVLAGCTAWKN